MSDVSALQQIHVQTTPDELVVLRHARSPLHIQVVDDDPVTQHLIQSLLGANYHLTMSSSVGEAMRDYQRVQPDLVFLDVDLGDQEFNGFDVAYTICMQDETANIIILTAHESVQNIAHATRCGASGFLVKPFGASRILQYVQACEYEKFGREGS